MKNLNLGSYMVRRYLFLLIFPVLFLLFISYSYAAPTYGTHMPERRHWAWGMEAGFIVDRNLDNDEGGVSTNKYFITGSYGIFEWLSFDGKIGIGDVDWDRTKGNDDLDYSTNFAGAYGFRIKGYEVEEWGIKSVVGFQHISVHPEAKNQGGNKHEAIVDEWQGSVVLSKDIGNFVPYLGARYGTVDFIKWLDEHDRKRIQAEKYYGAIIGLDYWLNDRMKLNLEADLLDGEEYSVGISCDF